LPIKKNSKRVHKPQRRKPVNKSAGVLIRGARGLRPLDKSTDIASLVKAGVEKFILNQSTIDDFLRTMRSASKKEIVYAHQLTRSVLSSIVKQAIRKRQRKLKGRKRPN
jgi:hypothetical protein